MIAENNEASIRDALVYEIAMPKMAELVVIKKP
jgi:hypothetical protein